MKVTLISPTDLEAIAMKAASIALADYRSEDNSDKEKRWGWISNSKARALLGLSSASLQRYRSSGVLPFSRIGGSLYYKKEDIEAILESNLRTGTSQEVAK
jgi:hypothetical protein